MTIIENITPVATQTVSNRTKYPFSLPPCGVLGPAALPTAVCYLCHDSYHLNADSGNALKCQFWTDLSPALQGASQPRFLPVKMHSSVAVQFDSGVLVIASKEGSVQNAIFVPGRSGSSDRSLLMYIM